MGSLPFHRALLLLFLAGGCVAQNPKSLTYLRLGRQFVEQHLQAPASGEDWSAALRKRYLKAGIPASQIVDQTVPGSAERMVICTLSGRGDKVLVVSASLARPKDEDAAQVAWDSLAMLPLLAESLNGVSTESTIMFIAFSGDQHHRGGSSWYVKHLDDPERRKIKAAMEIVNVGRGPTTFDITHGDRPLADWLATGALALRLPDPVLSQQRDSLDFADAKAFRSADIPAITISSLPQRKETSFSYAFQPVNKLYPDLYYGTYQLLCVFLLDLDRVERGATPKSSIRTAAASQPAAKGPVFTQEQAVAMIAGQVNDARTQHNVRTLRPALIPELQGMVCQMAAQNHLDSGPFESYLKQKRLSGEVAVFAGSYPSLLPEQLQALKIGRYQKLSVAACIASSAEAKASTYWIAVMAFE
jgi:hypothetical protein